MHNTSETEKEKCLLHPQSHIHNHTFAGLELWGFNAHVNNISVISWRSVLLVEETTDLLPVADKLFHIILHRVHLAWAGFELTTLVVIGTDCIGSYKSNYHKIMYTTAPTHLQENKQILKVQLFLDLDFFPKNKINHKRIHFSQWRFPLLCFLHSVAM
jgi:hypothetical protein